MKLIPLKQFICDTCGGIINSPEEGWLEWLLDVNTTPHTNYGFKIIHHSSAENKSEKGCYNYTGHPLEVGNHLKRYLACIIHKKSCLL